MPKLAAGDGCGPNRIYEWKGLNTRYYALNEDGDGPSVILVHGLFVNADHWRRNAPALAAAGCRVFAVDLLGNGYSDKPYPEDPAARHPRAGSPYNFFTWADQLTDFAEAVVKPQSGSCALVCNSIGCISGLVAARDRPDLFGSCLLVAPNFRELHVAESPAFLQPAVSWVQAQLRAKGQGLFDALAKPDTVKSILKEPYADEKAVTDDLVDCLLTPLLTEGSADVVFDTLSSAAGPLPEQLLQDDALAAAKIWACVGDRDPWTPIKRVAALEKYAPVKRVDVLRGAGHCPHDENPALVNPLILEFLGLETPEAEPAAAASDGKKTGVGTPLFDKKVRA
ncbi:hypothetical protein AURANDRAFT_27134 [Aureococcus anophagefferens]|uniref:AB hydrolase-1 domain-containing protein n=1 Tax=Aureococcus anophagefferens TaxID=44056 RepID=F0YBI6_AURAN|nr:hypothetical protein AURANDRAFT_27134 [Aureococcus anophagefferens]EGB07672.1 hypothetical protein AURANDRAFT_27134 [Aureococcus anophagefferens]|eukprot:XP_009037666.1 hypothetical protein AURANDRAFT_27134 [Aureococcus anophagefferens]